MCLHKVCAFTSSASASTLGLHLLTNMRFMSRGVYWARCIADFFRLPDEVHDRAEALTAERQEPSHLQSAGMETEGCGRSQASHTVTGQDPGILDNGQPGDPSIIPATIEHHHALGQPLTCCYTSEDYVKIYWNRWPGNCAESCGN